MPALRLLGSKYRAQGVTEMHYGAVGEALLRTLRQSLGKHWTNETADAWTALYTVVAEVMTVAGQNQPASSNEWERRGRVPSRAC